MAASLVALFERGLNSASTNSMPYVIGPTHDQIVIVRIVATVCACVSLCAGSLALSWFIQMNRKFRHTLIMTLIMSDVVKDLNYVVFAIVTFTRGTVSSSSPYCQVSGFIGEALVEITDFSVLLIVIHMSLQVLNPEFAQGSLERFRHTILTSICLVSILLASLAFVNSNGGYQLVGPFCSLPIRPVWYRLALGWVQRYIIAIVIVALTIVIRIRVKGFQQTLTRLQLAEAVEQPQDMDADIIEESDENDSGLGGEDEKHEEKVEETKEVEHDFDHIPDDEDNQFTSDDLRRLKRQSYRRRPLTTGTGGVESQTRVVSLAFSAAPSSAVFSPYRDSFRLPDDLQRRDSELRSSLIIDMPARRQSVIDGPTRGMSVMDMPQRRASLVEPPRTSAGFNPRNSTMYGGRGERTSVMLAPPSRRSSIWDEIDASLDKKYANHRVSVMSTTQFDVSAAAAALNGTSTVSPAAALPALPAASHRISVAGWPTQATLAQSTLATKRQTFRQSRMYGAARRTLSIISRGPDADEAQPDSPAAILRRRHRYIQRQMRYLLLYPIVYLGLWLCPFILHCLQWTEHFAHDPPFALMVLTFISLTIFGFANSLIFCLREKPWTLITQSDGTIWDSLRPGFILGRLGIKKKGPDADEADWMG